LKILFFSDIHVYKHRGDEKFIQIALDFIDYIGSYSIRNSIKHLIFCGDLFHTKTKIDSVDFIKVRDKIREIAKKLNFYFIIGNHDMPILDSAEGSIIKAFDEYGKIIENYKWFDFDNIRFHLVSYRKYASMPEFKMSTKNILVMHQDIIGFKMNDNYINKQEGLNVQSLKQFDLVFSGHYHIHQSKGNIIYIGSPFQINFGERNDVKGFVVFDTSSFKWEFIEYKKAPKFKVIHYNEYKRASVKNKFIKVLIPSNIKNLIPIKNHLMSRGALSVDFSSDNEELIKELEFVEELNQTNIKNLAMEFLENIKIPDNLSKKKLIAAFDDVNDEYLSQKG